MGRSILHRPQIDSILFQKRESLCSLGKLMWHIYLMIFFSSFPPSINSEISHYLIYIQTLGMFYYPHFPFLMSTPSEKSYFGPFFSIYDWLDKNFTYFIPTYNWPLSKTINNIQFINYINKNIFMKIEFILITFFSLMAASIFLSFSYQHPGTHPPDCPKQADIQKLKTYYVELQKQKEHCSKPDLVEATLIETLRYNVESCQEMVREYNKQIKEMEGRKPEECTVEECKRKLSLCQKQIRQILDTQV